MSQRIRLRAGARRAVVVTVCGLLADATLLAQTRPPVTSDDAARLRSCALTGEEQARLRCVEGLARLPGAATEDVLARVLRDPATPSEVRGRAAQVTETLGLTSLGPALLDGLTHSTGLDEIGRIARALGRFRYAPAAPELQRLLGSPLNPHYRAEIGEVLAILGYVPAVPLLRALAEGPFPTGAWNFPPHAQADIRERARLALLRLTGPWSARERETRYLLEPPASARLGQPIVALLRLENAGSVDRDLLEAVGGVVVVDGVSHPQSVQVYDGPAVIPAGRLWSWELDLAAWVTTPGSHRVRFEHGPARTRDVTFVVAAL